jgi:hypothetical protein
MFGLLFAYLLSAAAAALIREQNIFFCRVEQISHHRIRKLEQTRKQLTIAKSFYE